MFTLAFWRATAERAVSTGAEVAAGWLVANATGLLDVDWAAAGSVTGLAVLLSVLKALAAARSGSSGPGFGSAERLP